MPHLFHLVGPPAVGKLTVARELERRTGVVVVDNHLVNDPVFVPMGVHRGEGIEATDGLRRRVFAIVLEAAALAPAGYGHVFTHWLPDDPDNADLVERLRGLARRRGVPYRPVWLRADPAVLAERVVRPDRARRAKLRDPEVLRRVLQVEPLPAPPDALVLDTTSLTASEVAERILGSC